MKDDYTPDGRNARARGDIAKQLLGDPIVTEVFNRCEAAFIKEWKEAKDTAERERSHAKVSVLDEVRRQLRTIQSEGEYAAAKDRG